VTDEDAIRALVAGYAAAADAGDGPVLGALFAEDAVLTTSTGGRLEGREAIATIPSRLARYDSTDHRVGPSEVVLDGDTAAGTTACEAHHLLAGVDAVMTITYHDTFVRGPDRAWRFATRVVDIERTDEIPIEPGP
jgi:uncharacterized protein (TIGR02246 family)